MRILIYSQDSLGLGHLRRTRNIALEVVAREPGSSILILADSPVAPFFCPFPGVDYLKLPTIKKVGDSDWQSGTLRLDIEDLANLRAKLILQAFDEFNPDVVLVDHMPVGALGELKPTLDRAMQKASRPKLFLGLRDILDRPEVTRRVWTETGAYEYLQTYDAVLIYGCREIYDADSAYCLSQHAQKLVYCNYVGPRWHTDRLPHVAPMVLLMGGGGADFFPLAKAFLDALPMLLQKMPLQAMILTGPNMAADQQEALLAQATPFPVQIQSGTEDAIGLLQRASSVVTMAGYNSLCEVLQYRKKALVVPRAGPSAEQRMRSQLFSRRSLVLTLDPDDLSAESMAGGLFRLATEDAVPDPANIPPLDGAKRTAEMLLGD